MAGTFGGEQTSFEAPESVNLSFMITRNVAMDDLKTLPAISWKSRQFLSRIINRFGWVSLLFGVLFGGLQTFHHVNIYYHNSRRVTLDRVYAILFLWCFWTAVSIGYVVSAMLCKYDARGGVIATAVLAIGQISVVALIFVELYLL